MQGVVAGEGSVPSVLRSAVRTPAGEPRTAEAPPQPPPPPGARRARSRPRLPHVPHPRRWVAAVAATLVVLYAAVSFAGAWVMTKGTHEAITVAASSIGPVHEDVVFPSRVDRLTMRGWLFHAAPSNGRSVVMVHGFRNNRVNTAYGAADVGHDLVTHGYDVLLFDMRSCGESDGDRFTAGNLEQRDLLGAYDFMRSRGYRPARMTVLGVSLGAATEIMTAAQMRDVGAMVADSAFAEIAPVIADRASKESPLPGFVNWGVIRAAGLFFDLDANLRPVDAVRALPDRAFLFMQASEDDWFPESHARELFAASANPHSRLIIVDAVGHAKTYRAGPAAYMESVYTFIDEQMDERGG